jgi:hypothetical protein
LLNSSLSSIPTYFLSVFAPKKWFIKRVNKIRRGFLWKGSEDANGGTAWSTGRRCRGQRSWVVWVCWTLSSSVEH